MRNLGRTLLHVLVILVLLMASINARERSSSSGFHQGSTREEILANRARQKQHLEKLMAEAHQKLSDHKSGRKPLTEEDLAEWEKKYHIYQRKLDTMEGDMDEREVERIQKREELRHHRDEERRRRRQQEEEEL